MAALQASNLVLGDDPGEMTPVDEMTPVFCDDLGETTPVLCDGAWCFACDGAWCRATAGEWLKPAEAARAAHRAGCWQIPGPILRAGRR